MTGNASNVTEQAFEFAGVGALLNKPFTHQDLLQVMAGVMTR
tara:strand:- start:316 stop:441 length:126 start_codon:yes stop_codon:yes gene_type:complete